MTCPVPGLAELFEKPLKKISFPRELEKRVHIYCHFLQKDSTEQKTQKQKEKSLGNFADKNNFVNKKQKKVKKKRKKKTSNKSDVNTSEELDYKSIQNNDDNTINAANYVSDTDKNPSLLLPDKKTINTHKWPKSLQSKKDEILAINSKNFENVSTNIDFDLVGSLLGGHQMKTNCNSLKRKRKADGDENIAKHVNIQDKVHAKQNDSIITENQDIMKNVIPAEKKSENAICNVLISDETDPQKEKQFEETTKILSQETLLENPLVTDINIPRYNEHYIHPVTYKTNYQTINDTSYTSTSTTKRTCEYMYKGNRNIVNEQPVRRNTRSMSRGLSQQQQHFKAESNWSEKLMDLVKGSPMETEVIPSSRESCKPEAAIPKRSRKKNKKSAESTKAYWAKRNLEMQREKEKREYDAKMPCVFYKKHGECSYGDLCRFSHDIEVDKRKECCKYYVAGACIKGNDCRFFHSEWPCKFFHISKFCSNGDSCKFSHAEITPEIKKLFDARILYEESLKNTEKPSTLPEVSSQDGSGTVVDDDEREAANIVNKEEKADEIEETSHSPKKVEEFHFPSLYYEL